LQVDWSQHHRYILAVGDLLAINGIDYAVSNVEVAFDTLSEEAARSFANSVSLKWDLKRCVIAVPNDARKGISTCYARVYVRTEISPTVPCLYYRVFGCRGKRFLGKRNLVPLGIKIIAAIFKRSRRRDHG